MPAEGGHPAQALTTHPSRVTDAQSGASSRQQLMPQAGDGRSQTPLDAALVEAKNSVASALALEVGQQFIPSTEIFAALRASDRGGWLCVGRNVQSYRPAVRAFQQMIEIFARCRARKRLKGSAISRSHCFAPNVGRKRGTRFQASDCLSVTNDAPEYATRPHQGKSQLIGR